MQMIPKTQGMSSTPLHLSVIFFLDLENRGSGITATGLFGGGLGISRTWTVLLCLE